MCEWTCSVGEEWVKGGNAEELTGARGGSGEGRERMLEIWLSKARKRSMEMRNWSFCSVPEFVEDNGFDQTEVVVGWTGEGPRGGESNSLEEEWLSSPPKAEEGKAGTVSGACG